MNQMMGSTKKGELSLQIIVIAVICLVVLVVLIVIVANRSGKFASGSEDAENSIVGGQGDGSGVICKTAFEPKGVCWEGSCPEEQWIDCSGTKPCCIQGN